MIALFDKWALLLIEARAPSTADTGSCAIVAYCGIHRLLVPFGYHRSEYMCLRGARVLAQCVQLQAPTVQAEKIQVQFCFLTPPTCENGQLCAVEDEDGRHAWPLRDLVGSCKG